MKKISTRILPLFIVLVMILTMAPMTFVYGSSLTAAELKASMKNANDLPSPTDVDERAARGCYEPYNGYFEESFTTGGAAGRKARFYIPEGAFVRNYFLTIALPSGTDVEEFLVNSGWINVANATQMCLMILLPNGDHWGTFAEEKAYFGALLDGYSSGRRWYSIYSEFYLAGYGDGGDILQQWAGENPLMVISQAYFDSAIDASVLAPAGEFYYIQNPSNKQAATTSATPVEMTFECVKKKDVPVPTYFFGKDTPQGAIDYWKDNNECDATVKAGAGPLGSDIFFQNKTNSNAIATAVSNVVSRVAVLNKKVDYVDPTVTKAVYDGLAIYTRYTNSSAWSNALGYRPDHSMPGVEIVDIWRMEGTRNVKRQYFAYVPEKVKDKTLYPNGAPVIYAFGGNGNNAFQFFESCQYIELADTYGFSFVMPSEHTSSNGVTTTWSVNEYDYQFVLAVMAQMEAKYGQYFDHSRFFAMGHSQGGSMTSFLSQRDPDLFTAYALMSGSASSFLATTPAAPVYGTWGEYDSGNSTGFRNAWLKRNGLTGATAVITDPFSLPTRYGNSVKYLIYPNSAAYPGDQFATTSWFDANGIPMVNDTLAYGREHNNTVPTARRIWTQWFSKWSRDEQGNREYSFILDGDFAPLKLNEVNSVNAGSAIPVKFGLRDFNRKYIVNADAKLYYAPVDGGVVGDCLPAAAIGNANAENSFRYSAEDNQYVFNMDTKGLEAGDYKLKIVFAGTTRIVNFDLTITAKGKK